MIQVGEHGTWKGGVWYPVKNYSNKEKKEIEPRKKKAKLPKKQEKKLSDLEKYQQLCVIYKRQQDIRKRVAVLMNEYRSLSQKIGPLMKDPRSIKIIEVKNG